MKPKLLQTELANFEQPDYDGKNDSGITPIGDTLLILPDVAAQTAGKLGLIHIPESQKTRDSLASESGLVIAIGEGSFEWNVDRSRPFSGRKPKLGDRVVFQRYAGTVLRGRDDKMYRVMSDNSIAGILEGATNG